MGFFTDKRMIAGCAAAVCAGMLLLSVSACGASSADNNPAYSGEHSTVETDTAAVVQTGTAAAVRASAEQPAQNKT